MGTGKSVVGKRLARRLGWRFVDVDTLIEARARRSIARIIRERGEPVFRRLERRVISQVVRGHHQVIATGGGAVTDAGNRSRLRASGPLVCLRARPGVILQRVGRRAASARPLLAGPGSLLGRIRRLLARRAAAYAHADLMLDTSDRSVEEVVEQLWRQVSPHICRGWEYLRAHTAELSSRYGGKYVVVANDRIVACGATQLAAYQKASRRLPAGQETGIYYIPLPEESLVAL
jgi:shikimate kinase